MGRGKDDFDLPDVPLDDAFVAAARMYEPTALELEERAARAQVRTAERAAAPRERSKVRLLGRALRGRRSLVVVGVVVVAMGIVFRLAAPPPTQTAAPSALSGDQQAGEFVTGGDRPPPRAAQSSRPMGTPRAPTTEGPYEFSARQSGTSEPVAYDPCRPIAVVVNYRTAPPGAVRLLTEAVTEVSTVTGLQFVLQGPTDEAADKERAVFQPERYGQRWAPVLVAWSDPAEQPDLIGRVIGIGGSTRIEGTDLPARVYVSGMVALDGPQLAELLEKPDGWAHARSVLLHELGHLVGLAHVQDSGQLMHADAGPEVIGFQGGDLAGLAQLGAGRCFDRL